MPTQTSLALPEFLRTALAHGAVGFTLRSGLHPVIYSEKRVPYELQPSTSKDIEQILRSLVSTRELRQLRGGEAVHFTCTLEGVSLLGGAKLSGHQLRVELRRMAA